MNRTRKLKYWKSIVGERTSHPQQTKAKDAPQQPEPDSEEDQPSEEEEKPSENEVEQALSKEPTKVTPQSESEESEGSGASSDEDEDAEAHLVQLCDEGGVIAINFLLSKAVSPTTMDIPAKSPKEWTYRDIAHLPEAEQKEWRTACHNELDALKRRKVFSLTERPKGHKVIKNCLVFDVKPDGRKRARLVAKGFLQVEGLDYDQVFSPVIRFETVHLILAMAALENWSITGLDVWNAYLYGKLDEEIYMEQPEGFVVPGESHKVI